MLIDSHCHLDKLDLTHHEGCLDSAMNQAFERGVDYMLCIGTDLETVADVVRLSETYAPVYATVGVHPLYRESREPRLGDLVQWAEHPKVVAIGETGLDYFYGEGDLSWQRQRFEVHLQAALDTQLPLIVHTRGAKQDTLDMLQDFCAAGGRGVLHCFTEDLDMAQQAVDMGFMISISGIVTFRNADELRAVVAALPLTHLLVETDSPWLAPVPHRGKKNEPQYVVEVAQCVADVKGLAMTEVANETSANFFKLFNKAVPAT